MHVAATKHSGKYIIVIIIIIITCITFMKDIYNYILEKNHLSSVYSFVAIE